MSHLKLLTRSYQKGCICVLKIKVKYFDDELKRIQKISIGDWIDLRAAQDVTLKKVFSCRLQGQRANKAKQLIKELNQS